MSLGHGDAELLTQASRQIMVEMVAIIFSRLGDLPALDLSAEETHSLAHSPRLAVCHNLALFRALWHRGWPGRILDFALPAVSLHFAGIC
jgi:hypothetical protein